MLSRRRARETCLLLTLSLLTLSLWPGTSYADGLSAVKECENDSNPPEEIARLSLLPNGETRGSDTAATLIKVARQKAAEGKDAEALQWAVLCRFEVREQEEIKRDSAAVLRYLRQ